MPRDPRPAARDESAVDDLIARVKRTHRRTTLGDLPSYCAADKFNWPCVTFELAEALEAERATSFGYWTTILDCKREATAERARERLSVNTAAELRLLLIAHAVAGAQSIAQGEPDQIPEELDDLLRRRGVEVVDRPAGNALAGWDDQDEEP